MNFCLESDSTMVRNYCISTPLTPLVSKPHSETAYRWPSASDQHCLALVGVSQRRFAATHWGLFSPIQPRPPVPTLPSLAEQFPFLIWASVDTTSPILTGPPRRATAFIVFTHGAPPVSEQQDAPFEW